jgi:hypothetical protein
MAPAPASRYDRVHLAAWQCATAAGDAAASWAACRDGRSALRLRPGIGWCGAIAGQPGGIGLVDLAERAARGPWSAIAGRPGAPAFACAASKGDQQAMDAALAGDLPAFHRADAAAPTMALARRLGLRLLVPVPAVAACSTGLYALLAAADLVESGRVGHGLAGASDACLTPLVLAGFAAMGVLCGDHPPGTGRGFAPAEGAGFAALADAGPWRLVAGVRTGDARHETRFLDPQTLEASLAALWSALPDPDLLIVHGTGTGAGDAYEQAGLAAGPWRSVPRLHCKPMIGHCLGASGIVELALGLEAPVQRLWKLSLGFGGHLAAVAVVRS